MTDTDRDERPASGERPRALARGVRPHGGDTGEHGSDANAGGGGP